ncbi:hypothetical protein PVAND_010110 [Polypedilum vanderplanki]|uniref:Phosphatidylinositol N-acetylglucosaminyltransferase subunit Q n=1 Tax=Polypedilum vanderplanki TaxID=319348 RepID=A0A9J6CFN5_POLVA|nr:hypothetical protein PVAND_010110 [Polypedilum vanderplanki]
MEIHIYLPNNYNKFKYYYGQKRIETRKTIQIKVYYVTKCTNEFQNNTSNLILLGCCENKDTIANFNLFLNQEREKILNIKLEREKCSGVMIFNYKPTMFKNFRKNDYTNEVTDQYFFLYLANLLQSQEPEHIFQPTKLIYNTLDSFAKIATTILKPFSLVFHKTAIHQHAIIWRREFNEKRQRNGSILFDVLLGLMICFLMYHMQNPESYFMSVTEFILEKLRMLLELLDGSPVGLKLNVQLNNFLLKCFMYHVDLWWNFIIIVEPAIRYLFIPITILGILGFSFQCAMLCDIITLISLHAHCFYIYAAMLYKLELTTLRSLWRMVIGRRLNILKNRVESQKYSNRQLFLATLFFTTLLFLLPTVLVYYFVFAALRMLIYGLTFVLLTLQQMVLKCSLYDYLNWIIGKHSHPENISIDLVSHVIQEQFDLYQFQMTNYKSSPWKSSEFMKTNDDNFNKPIPLDKFFKKLLCGDLMAFSNVE